MVFGLFSSSRKLRAAVLATTIVSITVPNVNAASDTPQSIDPIRSAFQTQYGQSFNTGSLTQYLTRLFTDVDFDGAGLDQSEIILYQKMTRAARRAQIATQMLKYDLDGDTIVTRAEIRTYIQARQSKFGRQNNYTLTTRLKKTIDNILLGDPNNDGRIEVSEYDALSKLPRQNRRTNLGDHSGTAMALLEADPNKDGVLTQIEAMGLIGKAFRGIKITPRVRDGFRPKASCKAPKAAKEAQVIVVGAYEGSSVPSVTIAGQDKETSTSKITIEEGKKSIYLVVTSYTPMIWRLNGATNRISHMLISGRAGITGVSKDRVSFLSARDCLKYFYKLGGIKETEAKVQVETLTGRKPTSIVGQYTLHELRLPSGDHTRAKKDRNKPILTIIKSDTVLGVTNDGKSRAVKVIEKSVPNDSLKRNILRFNPGGIITINAKSVVSDAQVADYEVLPQEAGLLQLVTSGALEIISNGQFRVVKKMRYPAGLAGAHGQKFLIKRGVPEPTGDPGHSCVFSEDKGDYIAGLCR